MQKIWKCSPESAFLTLTLPVRPVQVLVTVEEGAIGGFAAHVLNFLTNEGLLDNGSLKFRSMMLPDRWSHSKSMRHDV